MIFAISIYRKSNPLTHGFRDQFIQQSVQLTLARAVDGWAFGSNSCRLREARREARMQASTVVGFRCGDYCDA